MIDDFTVYYTLMRFIAKHNRFIELLHAMTLKELRARYKRTVFGFIWIIVNPLLQMIVIGYIFTFIIKQEIPYYFQHLFVSLLAWGFFSQSLSKATPSVFYQRTLIKKAKFPISTIPISIILSHFIHFLIALIVLAVPMAIIFNITSLYLLLVCIIASLWLLLFTIGLSLITCSLNVQYRDINFLIQAGLMLWFYATPVIYPLSFIPHQYHVFFQINPVAGIMQLFQYSLSAGEVPIANQLYIPALLTVCLLFIGARMFQQKSKEFDDWL